MAAGNTYWCVEYLKRVLDFQSADFGATPNTIKCALIKSAANGGIDPSVTDVHPTWGASGTTDYSTAEVTIGGNYSAGGVTCTLPNTVINGNAVEIDWENPSPWDQHASNPTDARWAIFYDAVTYDCICFYDLGTDRDMTSGKLTLTMGAPSLNITADTP